MMCWDKKISMLSGKKISEDVLWAFWWAVELNASIKNCGPWLWLGQQCLWIIQKFAYLITAAWQQRNETNTDYLPRPGHWNVFFFFFYCQEDTQWHWWTMIYTCYFTRWSTLQLSQEYTKLAMLSKTFQTTLCNNVSALLHVFEKQLVLALFWKFKDVWLCKNTYVTFWQQIVKSRSSEHTWK